MLRRKNVHTIVMQGLKPLFPRLWRYCLTLTGSRDGADDLAQAACLRAIEKSHLFTPGSKLDSWVFRIAQRVWLNELRAEAVRRGGGMVTFDEFDVADARPGPESNLLAREVLLEVMALPEAQRATVMLVYVEGYSYKEASEILEIPIGTVMSRLAASRSKLARKFDHKKSSLG